MVLRVPELSLIGKKADIGENFARGGSSGLRLAIFETRSSDGIELVVKNSKMIGISPVALALLEKLMETLGESGGEGRLRSSRAHSELDRLR